MPNVKPACRQAGQAQNPNIKWLGKILFVLLFISAVVFVWSVYNLKIVYRKAGKISFSSSAPTGSGGSRALIEKVSRLILLPQGEVPSIATINNVAQLQKDSLFYKDARNGDMLLIYFQAKKAFIYDLEKNIIVNTGPVFMEKVSTDVPAVSTSTTSTPL
jgi:hypothetical protein